MHNYGTIHGVTAKKVLRHRSFELGTCTVHLVVVCKQFLRIDLVVFPVSGESFTALCGTKQQIVYHTYPRWRDKYPHYTHTYLIPDQTLEHLSIKGNRPMAFSHEFRWRFQCLFSTSYTWNRWMDGFADECVCTWFCMRLLRWSAWLVTSASSNKATKTAKTHQDRMWEIKKEVTFIEYWN